MTFDRHRVVVWSLRLGAMLLLLGLWLYSNGAGGVSSLLLPRLSAVIENLFELAVSARFWGAVGRTFTEIVTAFVISVTIGTLIGFWAARTDLRAKVVEPVAIWGYMAPLILFYPLFILWLGVGPESKVAFAVTATVFPVAYGALRAFRSVDEMYMRVGRAYGASAHQIDWLLKMRATLPMLASSFRIGAAYCTVTVIVTEMLASNGGLGYELAAASQTFAVAKSFALIIAIMTVVGLFQLGLDKVFSSARTAQAPR